MSQGDRIGDASLIGRALFRLYVIDSGRLRQLILRVVTRLESGEFYSATLRRIFAAYHDVHIGMYTHGGCFLVGSFDRHTTIGRYCSIAATAHGMNRNHPLKNKSTHAFFFNPALKYCKDDRISYTPLEIGNDVWIGHNAIIMPHVNRIGDGAVIGAGAVVHTDVPPFAIMVGNPARPVKYRFPRPTIEKLLAERWWDKPIGELCKSLNEFVTPLEDPAAAVPMAGKAIQR
jgi:virginiamycin A acetyltransferase